MKATKHIFDFIKKRIPFLMSLLMFSEASKAQSSGIQLVSNRLVESKTATKAMPVKHQHLLPLFGETTKSVEQIELEIKFLNDCDQNFDSRTEASKFFVERGWEYLKESELDTACYRFNLAYLLDNKNVEAYWGLGVVCFQQGYLTDAERLLRRGITIDSTNVGLLVDLATVDVIHYKESQENYELLEAEKLLSRALEIDYSNANTHLKKAVLEYHKGNYNRAWESIHKTRELDQNLLDFDFIAELMAKRCDPKGIFSEQK
jgi:tetratricopeptide (TPR) repeat protein